MAARAPSLLTTWSSKVKWDPDFLPNNCRAESYRHISIELDPALSRWPQPTSLGIDLFLCKNYKYTILFSRPGIRDTAELPFLLFPRPHTLSPFTILDAVGTKAGRKKEKKSGNNPDGIDYFTSRATPLSASFFFPAPRGSRATRCA